MTQAELQFDICAARHQGNERSKEANLLVMPKKQSLRELIYSFISLRGKVGATTEEVSERLNIRYTTASARMSELKRAGKLTKADVRKTQSGVYADVMVTI